MGIINEISMKDLTRYEFNNNEYTDCMLVAAVLTDYVVTNHNDMTYNELSSIFPKQLQGELGVFAAQETAQKIPDEFLISPCDEIQLKDNIIFVCMKWGKDNISRFIDHVMKLGYEITTVQSSYRLE